MFQDELHDAFGIRVREMVSVGFFGSHFNFDDIHVVTVRLKCVAQDVCVFFRRNDDIVLRDDVQYRDFGISDDLRVMNR